MKYLKKCILLCFTLFFIVLGAVMPRLASKMQDSQIGEFQKKTELGAVNLTLRQEGDVLPVLQLISKKHDETPWEGKTALSKEEALDAAFDVMEALNKYGLITDNKLNKLNGLLQEDKLKNLTRSSGYAEPQMLVGADGSSALIWSCAWDGATGELITIDDATGKAIRMRVRNELAGDDADIYLDRWVVFLQDYYDIEITDRTGYAYADEPPMAAAGEPEDAYNKANKPPMAAAGEPVDAHSKNEIPALLFTLSFSAQDGTALCNFNLTITGGDIFFNYR